MSYIKKCTKCGQRISLREMPHGKWVAFDASTEIAHKCYKKNNPDKRIKDLAKNKFSKEASVESISIKYENEPTSLKTSKYEIKKYEESNKIKEEINKNLSIVEDNSKEISAEELIKDYKFDNLISEEKYSHTSQNNNNAGFFKLVIYVAGFFLVVLLLAKVPSPILGLIILAFFIFFIAKR
jgi:RecG-like helicase